MKENEIKKVLFYTHSPRAFRTTLIGYLYEICQVYPTVLLSEKLDFETEEALSDKELFPRLEKIIPVRQLTGEKEGGLFAKNKELCNLAKTVVKEEKPDIVIAASDVHSMFEMYLMRFSKKINAINIAIEPSNTGDRLAEAMFVDLTNSYLRFPHFLPTWLKLFLVKCRKYLGHFLYYWILPLTVGEKPFFGRSSSFLRKGNSGMRDADYQVIFSGKDLESYLRDGVPVRKLKILSHPLNRETRDFFRKIYFNKFKKEKQEKNVFCLMLPGEIELGFKRSSFFLIPKEEREKKWVEVIGSISHIFPGWVIYIKPHPDTRSIDKLKEKFESISKNIKVVDSRDSADKYIETGDIIVGLPLSASTVLFTASLQCPEKPIISLDFHRELLGDYYRDFEGVEYVDSEEDLIKLLEKIRDKKYQKKQNLKKEGFLNTVELISDLTSAKNENN